MGRYLVFAVLGEWCIHELGVEEDGLIESFMVAELFPDVGNVMSLPVVFTCLVKDRFGMPNKDEVMMLGRSGGKKGEAWGEGEDFLKRE